MGLISVHSFSQCVFDSARFFLTCRYLPTLHRPCLSGSCTSCCQQIIARILIKLSEWKCYSLSGDDRSRGRQWCIAEGKLDRVQETLSSVKNWFELGNYRSGMCFCRGISSLKFYPKKQQVQHHFEVRIVVLRLTVSIKLYFNCIHREAVMEFISTTAAFRLTPLKY